MHMRGKLDGKVAIVTGGTSGMGKAIAALFAEEGASVVIGGRDKERGGAVVREMRSAGGQVEFVAGDIETYEANEQLVRTAVEAFGGVDVLVANAGILGLGSVTDVSLETWHTTIAANLHSVFYLLRLGIPEMQKREGGTVVINGSISAYKGFPNHAAYCASKGALLPLVKQVAIDYSPSIRINILCPGPVDTPLLWNSAQAFPKPEKAVFDAAEQILLKRLGTPRDVAKAALFLACSDSEWITGAALTIDGGIMA
ncbi:glucose 1-dehydrogenase [Acidobacteria bacterium AH-259-G07]|nr:glucose 1-dehydrogenase [Acidobacteria bacterium AH-259-G07]